MSSPRRSTSARGHATPRPRGPRGPLPPAVYWRRRLFVLGLAASLVFVIAGMLTNGSDGRSAETPVAEHAGAQVETSDSATASTTTTPTAGKKARRKPVPPPTPTLAAPEGACDPADIVVTPAVDKAAVAGRDVTIALSLQTIESEACTWQVAPRRITVKIAEDGEEIWTTRHCRRVVPTQAVVVRRAVPTVVRLTWNARESEEGCRRATEWVGVGDYTIAAAALGGEPVVADFALASPTPETIYVTPKGESTKQATPKKKPTKKPSETATGR